MVCYFNLTISPIQIAFYEQTKQILLGTRYFEDNVITHFSASIIAVSCACNGVKRNIVTLVIFNH